jgi:hypothetical protein
LTEHHGRQAENDHVTGHGFLFDDSDKQQRTEADEETLPWK